jgi:hypothetical protein
MADEQESSDRRPRGSLAVSLIAIAVAVLPIAYVLLSGPAVWLFQHGYGRGILPLIYKPMIWLEQSGTTIGRLVAWYWSLWK